MSETPKLIAALVKAQRAMKPASKDSTNPHFRSKYASLTSVREAVMEVFGAQGLGFDWEVAGDKEGVRVKCVILHESGERLVPAEWYYLPAIQQTPQAFGSATTYGKRYTLEAAAGITTDEDDDANAASMPTRAVPQPPPPPARAQREMSEGERLAAEPSPKGTEEITPEGDFGPEIPFGKNKGKRASQLTAKSLEWYIERAREELSDPAKAKFHAKTKTYLRALEDVLNAKRHEAYSNSAFNPEERERH